MWRRWLSTGLCLLLIWPLPLRPNRADRLAPNLRRALHALSPDQKVSVIVHLADRLRLRPENATQVLSTLRREATASQALLLEQLRTHEAEGRAKTVTPFWIFNGVAVTASRDVILEIAGRPDVARIVLDEVVEGNALPAPHFQTPEPGVAGENLKLIGAPEAWARGVTGKGVVVATLDTGVDMSYPELASRWRGGANSWFDPTGEYPDEPFDVNGHGTQVLGVILGGDVGVAPNATWIAARIFDQRDRATTSNIHKALQWVLDPDGDPNTADAPDVVNNSWSFITGKCDSEFADDLRALRAAGILPVFAAGVNDPLSPADTLDAFAVGALATADIISIDSPRGPSVCKEVSVFPQIVAPGENIRTTDRFGLSVTLDGTSLAAAHVSGALALLLSADPRLTVDEQANLLTETAIDLGEPGPDNVFGYGRLNVAAALDRLLGPDPAAQATHTGPPSQNDAQSLDWVVVAAAVLAVAVIGVIAWRRRGVKPS